MQHRTEIVPDPRADAGRRRGQRGQGTVEYVALVLLVAGILTAAVATAGRGFRPGQLAETVATKIQQSISQVSGGPSSGRPPN